MATKDQVEHIFDNIEALLDLSAAILTRLRTRINEFHKKQKIGPSCSAFPQAFTHLLPADIFLELAPRLPLILQYMNGFQASTATYNALFGAPSRSLLLFLR